MIVLMGFNERMPMSRQEVNAIDREVVIKKAYERARTYVHETEIQPEQFRDLYGKDVVDDDTAYVAEMEEKFTHEGEPSEVKKLATIFEALLHERIAYGKWLGSESSSQKTSRYDDIFNGVDEVVETEVHEAATSYLGLTLDATLGSADAKFKRIKREIDAGELSKVKYFRSKKGEFRGELSRVPRVVIATDAKTVLELATLWLNKDYKTLNEHPFQHQMLEEILLQLGHFETYARERGDTAIATTFARSRAVIEVIQKSKKVSTPDNPKKRDGGVGKIRGYLGILPIVEK